MQPWRDINPGGLSLRPRRWNKQGNTQPGRYSQRIHRLPADGNIFYGSRVNPRPLFARVRKLLEVRGYWPGHTGKPTNSITNHRLSIHSLRQARSKQIISEKMGYSDEPLLSSSSVSRPKEPQSDSASIIPQSSVS